MRISDWSSDVCSSDLGKDRRARRRQFLIFDVASGEQPAIAGKFVGQVGAGAGAVGFAEPFAQFLGQFELHHPRQQAQPHRLGQVAVVACGPIDAYRSEEHTSELQSLMRISYAVLCLNKKYMT